LLRQAEARDAQLARGESMGWMHGMPQAIKDLSNTAGIPTIQGTALMRNFVPSEDGLMAQRMKAAGCIVIGKTNVPEFGLGSHTFNEVFGVTRNPYDLSRTAGGSSGGAAVALATRMLPVADGSDFMGSLRNPAAWNNLFGFRPSQGRVPKWPAADAFISQMGTEGPMGRTVQDVAHLLDVQAGFDRRAPLSIADGARFTGPLDGLDCSQVRIGWLGDLSGYLAMEPRILEVCGQGLARLENLGCAVESIPLGTSPEPIWKAWLVWRRALVAPRVAAVLSRPAAREHIKPEALWEHRQGMGLGFMDFMRASEVRTAFHSHLLGLFERFDLLAREEGRRSALVETERALDEEVRRLRELLREAVAASQRLAAVNPLVRVIRHDLRIDSTNALEIIAGYDLVLDGTDNFPTRYLINDACVLLGKPDVWGSIFRFDGQASVWWAEHGPCYRCVFPTPPPPGLVPSCAEGGVLGVLCAAIGSVQAAEAVKLIVGMGDPLVGRLMVHDALRPSWDLLTVQKNPECAVCGASPTVTALVDYEDFCAVSPASGGNVPDGSVAAAAAGSVPQISATDLADLLGGGGAAAEVLLVDVRGDNERAIAGIPGAHPIHLDEFRSGEAVAKIPFDRPVVMMCKMGARSEEASRILIGAGHQDVRNLAGGVLAWVRDVDPAQPSY